MQWQQKRQLSEQMNTTSTNKHKGTNDDTYDNETLKKRKGKGERLVRVEIKGEESKSVVYN